MEGLTQCNYPFAIRGSCQLTIKATKLVKLKAVARMLEGEHEGEVFNAARMLTRMLREEGMNFADLVDRAFTVTPETVQTETQPEPAYRPPNPYAPAEGSYTRPPRRFGSYRGYKAWDVIRYALAHGERVTQWEHSFLDSLYIQGPKVMLTERQWSVLYDIGLKVGGIRKVA